MHMTVPTEALPASQRGVTRFWHYTCSHGHKGIQRDGFVKPNVHPVLGDLPLAWFTELTPPDRDALGLTSHLVRCDRTEWRYGVDPDLLQPWTRYRRSLIAGGHRLGVEFLELAPGAMPAHWWIATCNVPITRPATGATLDGART